jgi:ribosomal-protein-alanine N-acetyltransferase
MKEIEKIIVRTSQITFPFYQKQGFRLKEKIDNYWAEGFDLYYMEYQSK